jgi:hypothetical protein
MDQTWFIKSTDVRVSLIPRSFRASADILPSRVNNRVKDCVQRRAVRGHIGETWPRISLLPQRAKVTISGTLAAATQRKKKLRPHANQ